MAESYFDLLTEQEGLPAKPFDPVEELKRLRRGLELRLQISQMSAEEVAVTSSFREESIPQEAFLATSCKPETPETEQVSLESVMQKAAGMKKTFTFWQRSQQRTRLVRNDRFRGIQKPRSKKKTPSVVASYLTTPQEGTLETINAGLMALGIVSVVFGVLSFIRGLESDWALGSLVCITGAVIVVIGLGGRFLASRFDLNVNN